METEEGDWTGLGGQGKEGRRRRVLLAPDYRYFIPFVPFYLVMMRNWAFDIHFFLLLVHCMLNLLDVLWNVCCLWVALERFECYVEKWFFWLAWWYWCFFSSSFWFLYALLEWFDSLFSSPRLYYCMIRLWPMMNMLRPSYAWVWFLSVYGLGHYKLHWFWYLKGFWFYWFRPMLCLTVVVEISSCRPMAKVELCWVDVESLIDVVGLWPMLIYVELLCCCDCRCEFLLIMRICKEF